LTAFPALFAILIAAGGLAFTGCTAREPEAGASEGETADRAAASAAPGRFSVELPAAECALAQGEHAAARVGLRLFFDDPTLKAEILRKEDALLRVLRFVLSTKRPAEVESRALEAELKERFHPLLPEGALSRIEFAFELFIRDSG
jgi:flagellar basal body-associated protein FliL